MIYSRALDNKRTLILLHEDGSPAFNLAMEEAILDLLNREGKIEDFNSIVRIWINNPSIVIGYNLKPCEEVRCELIDLFKIPLVRRISGGGAVYHDSGNINISVFISKRLYIDEIYRFGTRLILSLLDRLGLKGNIENKNDVVVDGWKISGSAAAIKSRSSLFHATLLVDSDLEVLRKLIIPRIERVRSGEVTPSKYRPTNLSYFISPIDVCSVIDKLLSTIEEVFRNSYISYTTPEKLYSFARELYFSKYSKPEWSIMGPLYYAEPKGLKC